MNRYYRYLVRLTDGGSEIRVTARNPSGELINEPGGPCAVASELDQMRRLAKLIDQDPSGSTDIEKLGELLFKSLFPAEVTTNFRDLLAEVSNKKDVFLRLELDLDESKLPQIASLPWECLRAPQTSRWPSEPLATHRQIVLSRRRSLWDVAAPIQLDEPLRIQLVVSDPKNEELGEVVYEEVEETLHRLATTHSEKIAPPPKTLHLNEHQPSLRTIEEALEEREPHVLHFIGHGRLRQARGFEFGELALVGPTGRADWRTDDEIAELFQMPYPKVVFLQTCEGGATGRTGTFVGVASQIVQRNVPVVVAMQYPLSNLAAVTFTEEFYRQLGKLEPVDVSVQRGRRELRRAFRDQRDFAAPVLFMRVENGQLFVSPQMQEDDEDVASAVEKVQPTKKKALRLPEPFSDAIVRQYPMPIAQACADFNNASEVGRRFVAFTRVVIHLIKYLAALHIGQVRRDRPATYSLSERLDWMKNPAIANWADALVEISELYQQTEWRENALAPDLFAACIQPLPMQEEISDAIAYLGSRGDMVPPHTRTPLTILQMIAKCATREDWESSSETFPLDEARTTLSYLQPVLYTVLKQLESLQRYPLVYTESVRDTEQNLQLRLREFMGRYPRDVPPHNIPPMSLPKKDNAHIRKKRLYSAGKEHVPTLDLHPFFVLFRSEIYQLEHQAASNFVEFRSCSRGARFRPPEDRRSFFASLFDSMEEQEENGEGEAPVESPLPLSDGEWESEVHVFYSGEQPESPPLTWLSEEGREALEIGLGEALRIGHFWLGVEFLLMGLSKQPGRPFSILLHEMGLQPGSFRGVQRGMVRPIREGWRKISPLQLGREALPKLQVASPAYLAEHYEEDSGYPVVMTPRVEAIVKAAHDMSDTGQVGHRHLLQAIFQQVKSLSVQLIFQQAHEAGWSPEQVISRLNRIVETASEEMPDVPGNGRLLGKRPQVAAGGPILNNIGRNLTRAAREGELGEAHGENARRAMAEIGRILIKKESNNPVILGEAGVGKTAVVEGFAWRMAGHGKGVVEPLQDKQIIQISAADLLAGTKYRGDLEERLNRLLREVGNAGGQTFIFIDEIHTILGGESSGGLSTIADTLKPALSRGDFPCIGATTVAEYRRHIETDPALAQRFTPVWLEEPSIEDAIQIVQAVARGRLSQHYQGITFRRDAVEAAVELSARYLPDERLPRKAVKVLDEAAASLIVRGSLSGEPDDSQVSWGNQVTPEVVVAVVAARANIPVEQLAKSDRQRLRDLENRLKERIKGQDDAIRRVVRVLKRAGTGFSDPKRPLGVFLFTGPTGVGKTELALALAEALFDDEEAIFRLDMSEFMEKHQVSRLIGAPPGYVRSEEEGQLTGRLRRRPYTVVLLDEMEKAHEDVQHLFLQLFDDGRLTDSHGNVASGRNAIFIMTTNLGARQVMGFGRTPSYRQKLREAIYEHFSPEFMNRIDRIAYFEPLDEEALLAIFDREFAPFQTRFLQQRIRVEVPEEIKRKIVEQIKKQGMGARPLKRVIEDQIVSPLIDKLLEEDDIDGPVQVGADIEVRATTQVPWMGQEPEPKRQDNAQFNLDNVKLPPIDRGQSPLTDPQGYRPQIDPDVDNEEEE